MDAEKIVKQAKEFSDAAKMNIDVRHTKNGIQRMPTFKNLSIYLNIDPVLKPLFKYNAFASCSELATRPPWGELGEYPKRLNDYDILGLKDYFIKMYKIECPVGIINEAVNHYAKSNSYDPVKNYLTSLTWDKVPRLDNWLTTYLGVEDTEYVRFVGRMTLSAACARINKPGIKYDHMLILEGDQDIGKSMACKALGGAWYRELSLTDHTKETIERMQGVWIIEVPELAVFKKQAIESLKAFITCDNDAIRLPYEHRSMVFSRRNIFIGTINPDNHGYLSDTTGNRRFLPVECKKIDLSALQRDRDQLWAEAWQSHLNGFPMYMPDHIKEVAKEEQQGRQTADEWTEDIRMFIEGKDKITITEIWTLCLRGFTSDLDRVRQMRIGDCLRRLGWVRKTIRVDGKLKTGFVDPMKFLDFKKNEDPWTGEEEQ